MNVNDIKLYPHNQETYDKIQERWKTTNKVATVQATGTGKSYLILKCLYNEENENKIVLAPSNYILEQLESEIGETIPNTILMTYSKLSYMTQEEINQFNPSLIVLDEFHRCGAEQWGNGVQTLINTFPSAKILGASATHIRFLDNERNMADELFDNNIVNNLSLTEAIVREILPMPKYVSALYTFNNELDNLRSKVDNSKNDEESKEELYKEIDKLKNKLEKSKGIPQIFKKHLKDSNNDKFIVFCKDKNHLDEMKIVVTDWFKKAKLSKNIDSYTVYSGDNKADKQVELFKNNNKQSTIKLLFSIDMFNEGIHIKDVSGVILLRPTVSPIIYYQQIGRAIQVGKETNPLIFDFVNNFDSIGAKNFIGELRERVELKRQNENNNDKKSSMSDLLEFMVFDETLEVKHLFTSIEDKLGVWGDWDYMYSQLIEYKYIFGNLSIPKSNKTYKNLCYWIDYQRKNFNDGTLSNYKIDKLNNIDFIWNNALYRWNNKYNELKEYKELYGNCDVKKEYTSLYNWISKQRKVYRKNKLSEYKIKKLEDLDFILNVKNRKPVFGISYESKREKWTSNIKINNKSFFLGRFEDKYNAIKARRDAEIKYFGKSDINLDDFKDKCE